VKTETKFALALGTSIGAAVAGALSSYVLYKGNQRVEEFLQASAIDERNQRMHESRSLLMRLHSTPELSLDRAAPEAPLMPEIAPEDKQPYISDFEQDDERFQAFVEEIHGPMPDQVEQAGPFPYVGDD